MGFHNVVEAQGLSIAAVGMVIVFTALTTVSLLIALLPKVLAALSGILPPETAAPTKSRGPSGEEEAIVAAIGLALRERMGRPKGE